MSGWAKGVVEWIEGNTAFLSVVFSWDQEAAWTRARWLQAAGYAVRVGGPGMFVRTEVTRAIQEFATVGGDIPDAVARHNPDATFASRGCPVGCWFCVVPAMEGRQFTLLPDFPVRPILCDNNLSALPLAYQRHIVDRYQSAGVPLLDANSGFEPRTFTAETRAIWQPVLRGPWRFACDDQNDLPYVERTLALLADIPQRRKRVYVLIGNEPMASCLDRLERVIAWGGDPHAQPVMKLNARNKRPWVRHDWTERSLRDVARWTNRHLWQMCSFADYDRSAERRERPVPGQMAFSSFGS